MSKRFDPFGWVGGYLLIPLILPLIPLSLAWAEDALVKTQRIASDALIANNTRLRVAAENMANAQSVNYVPKAIYIQSKKHRAAGIETVEVKNIRREPHKMRKEYHPTHPHADEKGYINLPDVNPLIEMLNLQQARQDIERSLKVYEIATDLRYKMIGMMNSNR
jgi:flagellar basal-body rod protein FlgC